MPRVPLEDCTLQERAQGGADDAPHSGCPEGVPGVPLEDSALQDKARGEALMCRRRARRCALGRVPIKVTTAPRKGH